MEKIFLKLLNMSIAAGWLVLAVILLRILLRKAPRWLSCILWGIVAVRLVCPVSLESSLSLIPSAETINPTALTRTQEPIVNSGIQAFNSTVNPLFRDTIGTAVPISGESPLHMGMHFAGVLWAVGLLFLLLYAFAGFLRLRTRLREAIPLKEAGETIWLCDVVNTPFILGILRPRIYLPSSLGQTEIKYVLAHEQAHLKRKDHWWKLLAYVLLAVYWFHPLMWAAYVLFTRDTELACDEKVVGSMGMNEKKAYSHALVNCSTEKKMILTCPLAFGEIGVKARVRAVLNYHRPAFRVIFISFFVCIIVAVCFLTNPRQDVYQVKIVIPAGSGRSEIAYSEEEISPLGKKIVLSAGEGLGDTEVVLFPIEWEEERTYEPAYLTPGMSVKMDAEKGAWFRIGIYAENPTDEDKVVYVRAEGVDIRIVDRAEWAVIPMVMVNDKYYYDTNQVSTKTDRSLDMDGEITSAVKGTEKPAKNNQSNFGIGYVYQFGEHDTIEILIDGKWMIFEYRSGDGSLIRYGDHLYSVGDLSEMTLEWLEWYNSLSKEEQLSISYVPWDLQSVKEPENGTQDAAEQDAADLDMDGIVEQLLAAICSSPAASSNPGDYVEEHSLEYRELTYYGEYTLRYCLNRFRSGQETGLEGKIMALVCEELLQTKGTIPVDADTASTGQFWYDTLYDHESSLVDPYLE